METFTYLDEQKEKQNIWLTSRDFQTLPELCTTYYIHRVEFHSMTKQSWWNKKSIYCEITNIFFQFRSTCIIVKTQESKWKLLKKCLYRKRQVSSSPPTGLKRIPPGGGDVSQDRPGGPLYQPKPAVKNSLRKSSRNSGALLFLTALACISGHHVDALSIEKHDAWIKCGRLLIFLQS